MKISTLFTWPNVFITKLNPPIGYILFRKTYEVVDTSIYDHKMENLVTFN